MHDMECRRGAKEPAQAKDNLRLGGRLQNQAVAHKLLPLGSTIFANACGAAAGEEVMSQFFDRLTFFRKYVDRFSNGFGVVTDESRAWEDSYRQRWQHDKIVRSTHGTNCTGSCSWKIHVKNGLVTWETQQTDYPRTPQGACPWDRGRSPW
jgi:anaerobic selenocysteine-containing dehydrogenase